MKRLYYSLLCSCVMITAIAQQPVKLKINHLLGTDDFALQAQHSNNLGNAFLVERMQYYLSKVSVIHDGNQITPVPDLYVLVDASNPQTIDLGTLTVTAIEGVRFHVGVNAPENNQDPAQWPSDHALSPKLPSMHWGWASGYFFVAMSGQGGASLNNTFELHGLGNENYFEQTLATGAQAEGNDLVITINADYARALEDIDVAAGVVSHGATGEAADIIANFRDHVFSAPSNTGTTTGIEGSAISNNGVIAYPNPSTTGNFRFNSSSLPSHASHVQLTDLTGRIINVYTIAELRESELRLENRGVYFLKLMDRDKTLMTQKLVSK